MLIDYEVIHHRIPKGKPILNGYCERFQRTILEEFYKVIFRKQFFNSLNELNSKLQEYLVKPTSQLCISCTLHDAEYLMHTHLIERLYHNDNHMFW